MLDMPTIVTEYVYDEIKGNKNWGADSNISFSLT